MAVRSEFSGRGRRRASAAEMQSLADLVGEYPAETQLLMQAYEDGLTLGPMQEMDPDDAPSEAAHEPPGGGVFVTTDSQGLAARLIRERAGRIERAGSSSMNAHQRLLLKAEGLAQFVSLVHEYPVETQRIMAAINNGVVLGPEQILDATQGREIAPTPGADATTVDARSLRNALLRQQLAALSGPDEDWTTTTQECSDRSDSAGHDEASRDDT